MKFTVERIYNGYLITDLQPHGEIRQHVPSFLEVLKKLSHSAFLNGAPDATVFDTKERAYQYTTHSKAGWNTPETGYSYGVLDPNRVKYLLPVTDAEKESEWHVSLVPKEEFEAMRRKVADIKKSNQGMRSLKSEKVEN